MGAADSRITVIVVCIIVVPVSSVIELLGSVAGKVGRAAGIFLTFVLGAESDGNTRAEERERTDSEMPLNHVLDIG